MFFCPTHHVRKRGRQLKEHGIRRTAWGGVLGMFLFVCLCVRVCVWICLGLCVLLFSSATAGSISLVLLWHRMLGCDRWWQKLLSQRMGKKK